MMRITAAVVAIALATFGLSGRAQDPPKSPQVFRTSARLVQVTVVVTDRNGQPVRGLTREDFRLLEDGREQPIALFSSSERVAPAPVVAEPGVFTNRLHTPGGGGVIAIVYDRLNTLERDQARARLDIIRYLKTVQPDDRIALYVLDGGGMRIVHDFTRDARSLRAVLDRVQISSDGRLTVPEKPDYVGFGDEIDRAMEVFVSAAYENMAGFFEHQRAVTTIDGMEWVASHLAGVKGRKNIVWVSSGFPFTFRAFGPPGSTDRTQMSAETRRATRALSSADVAVYAIDARGLVGAFSSSPSAKVQTFHTLSSVYTPIDGIRYFADWTGGAAYFNTNDLATAIGRAVADSAYTYTLAYYPSNERWNGKFRSLAVKVTHAGARVRHRSGYFAQAVEPNDQADRDAAIQGALKSPLEATSVSLTATGQMKGDRDVELAIHLYPWDVRFAGAASGAKGSLDLVIAQRVPGDGTEEYWKDIDVRIPIVATEAERQRLESGGMRLTRTVRLRDGADLIKIVVRDGTSGATGSLMIRTAQIKGAS